jgi:hypothetical protein
MMLSAAKGTYFEQVMSSLSLKPVPLLAKPVITAWDECVQFKHGKIAASYTLF